MRYRFSQWPWIFFHGQQCNKKWYKVEDSVEKVINRYAIILLYWYIIIQHHLCNYSNPQWPPNIWLCIIIMYKLASNRKYCNSVTSFCISILSNLTLKAAMITRVVAIGSEAMNIPIASHLSANIFPYITSAFWAILIIWGNYRYILIVVPAIAMYISLQCSLSLDC